MNTTKPIICRDWQNLKWTIFTFPTWRKTGVRSNPLTHSTMLSLWPTLRFIIKRNINRWFGLYSRGTIPLGLNRNNFVSSKWPKINSLRAKRISSKLIQSKTTRISLNITAIKRVLTNWRNCCQASNHRIYKEKNNNDKTCRPKINKKKIRKDKIRKTIKSSNKRSALSLKTTKKTPPIAHLTPRTPCSKTNKNKMSAS